MIPGVTVDIEACFSADYRSARDRFLEASQGAQELRVYPNTHKGPSGELLATDTAWFGPIDARQVLVMVSATHGVEGFCGSGAQLDALWIGVEKNLPKDTGLLLVHALNPYGFAWVRRTTEEGVDLNRNGVDFSKPLPGNPGYAELADAFVPRSLSGNEYQASMRQLEAFRETHGARALEEARSCGQYTDPKGVYYGGTSPTWSMRTLQKVCADHRLDQREAVAVIDYHSGLGPFGYGEAICGHRPGESGQTRCRAWYGDGLGEPLLGTSASLPIIGLTQYAWARAIGDERLTFIALEFGTYDRVTGFAALQADHWLYAYGTPDWPSPVAQDIKSKLKNYYFPNTRDWRIRHPEKSSSYF